MNKANQLLSIYVHYPYCSKICSFCAFNKYQIPENANNQTLFQKYRQELSYNLASYKRAGVTNIRSVYFGGGTPSLAPQLVTEVREQIKQEELHLTDDAEITLEAIPTSLPEIQYLQGIGVTRVSLGAQSLVSDAQLKQFNREHTVQESLVSLELLSKNRSLLRHGFSFDLMFGLPSTGTNQDPKQDFDKELQVALPYALTGGHLSLYELTVEHGTPLSKQVRKGQITMPDEYARADQYQIAVDRLTQRGFDHYEISSFALPGHYSRHNIAFWMHEDLIGIGPGAHGRVTGSGGKYRTRCIPDPKRWAEQIEQQGHGQARRDYLQNSFAEECISIGLRTETGVSRAHFRSATGIDLENYLDMQKVYELQGQGLLQWTKRGTVMMSLPDEYKNSFLEGYLKATERGRSVLDLITPMLLKE